MARGRVRLVSPSAAAQAAFQKALTIRRVGINTTGVNATEGGESTVGTETEKISDAVARHLRLPFAVVLQRTGDRAEAATAEAILLAAATLVDDARSGIQGDVRALRDSIVVTENGTYAGVLTAFARQGVRSI